jgi:hypothetical protein
VPTGAARQVGEPWCKLSAFGRRIGRSSRGEFRVAEVARARKSLGWGGFLLRLLLSIGMVFATWNPSGYSFTDWLIDGWDANALGAVHAFFAVVLLIGWVILLRATFNSLGMLGLVLGGMLLGATVWLLFDLGVLRGDSTAFYSWIALGCVGLLLAIGLSWSLVWKRMTGQVDVDDFDGN